MIYPQVRSQKVAIGAEYFENSGLGSPAGCGRSAAAALYTSTTRREE